MLTDTALAIEAEIRDTDLLERLADSNEFGREFTRKSCIEEQQRRDALKVMRPLQRRRNVTRFELEERGAASRDNLRHIHSVLALCSLPYTKQALEVREWNRNQGRMKLSVTAGRLMSAENGDWIDQPLPYGSRARLLLLHVCSEAIRTNSPTIEIEDTLCGFIRSLGFPVTGGKYGTITTFKEQINALAACTMRIGTWDGDRARTVSTSPFSSLSVSMFSNGSPEQGTLWPTTLSLSLDFYQTLTKHALPINLHAARAFANSPRKLDLLFWLGYRLHGITRPVAIPWEKLAEQWGANYTRFTNFKRDFAQEIAEIKEVFPKLPVTISDVGCIISPGSSEVMAIPTKPMK